MGQLAGGRCNSNEVRETGQEEDTGGWVWGSGGQSGCERHKRLFLLGPVLQGCAAHDRPQPRVRLSHGRQHRKENVENLCSGSRDSPLPGNEMAVPAQRASGVPLW
ncbi:Hypothetical predicted protein [Marmota monax]|uniref:Uncharacterized protein n=1 Tax=Marmota monax TaxID=9995 RepID=A0A5E4D949_MARMO|nr:hypothetical protein GHT09_016059 [Marmota monax]VTJ90270.1 Hypothetical predicted protein [Marmota monax]